MWRCSVTECIPEEDDPGELADDAKSDKSPASLPLCLLTQHMNSFYTHSASTARPLSPCAQPIGTPDVGIKPSDL